MQIPGFPAGPKMSSIVKMCAQNNPFATFKAFYLGVPDRRWGLNYSKLNLILN